MHRLTKTLFRDLLVLLVVIGVLAHGSSVRAQTITTVDALWAWDGQNVSVCQDPTSSASISGCFGNLTNSIEIDTVAYNPNLPLATDGTYVYLATQKQGWAYKCPISGYGSNCTTILVGPFNPSSSNTEVWSIAASSGYLWIGQSDGTIYRCPSDIEWTGNVPSPPPSDCLLFDNAGNRNPGEMVIANGWLYVGLIADKINRDDSLIWRCDLSTPNACTDFNNPGNSAVQSLAVGAGYLWAGLANGILWRCDLNNANGCRNWAKTVSGVTAVSYDSQGGLAVGAAGSRGVFWSCPTATSNSCTTILSNRNISNTAAGTNGSIAEHFGAFNTYNTYNGRQIFNDATPYESSYQNLAGNTPILYIPEGGVVTPGSVNVSVPLQNTPLASASTSAKANKRFLDGKLAKLVKRCERGKGVKARITLQGPHGSVNRKVDLCEVMTAGRPEINFAGLDKGVFYKITASVEGLRGAATFYLSKTDEIKEVSIELRRQGK